MRQQLDDGLFQHDSLHRLLQQWLGSSKGDMALHSLQCLQQGDLHVSLLVLHTYPKFSVIHVRHATGNILVSIMGTESAGMAQEGHRIGHHGGAKTSLGFRLRCPCASSRGGTRREAVQSREVDSTWVGMRCSLN